MNMHNIICYLKGSYNVQNNGSDTFVSKGSPFQQNYKPPCLCIMHVIDSITQYVLGITLLSHSTCMVRYEIYTKIMPSY